MFLLRNTLTCLFNITNEKKKGFDKLKIYYTLILNSIDFFFRSLFLIFRGLLELSSDFRWLFDTVSRLHCRLEQSGPEVYPVYFFYSPFCRFNWCISRFWWGIDGLQFCLRFSPSAGCFSCLWNLILGLPQPLHFRMSEVYVSGSGEFFLAYIAPV